MKRFYEIALMQHVKGSVPDDFETVIFDCESLSYRECQKWAKEYSKHIGEVSVPHVHYTFNEREANKEFHYQGLDAGLAAVKIVCYTEDEYTSYQPLYHEYYCGGKVDYKVCFNESGSVIKKK